MCSTRVIVVVVVVVVVVIVVVINDNLSLLLTEIRRLRSDLFVLHKFESQ